MKYLRLLFQIAFLCGVSLVGNILSQVLYIKLPGSIIGMIILFLLLELKIVELKQIEAGANFLLAELLLFFIPASVGIIEYRDSFSNYSVLGLLITIVFSTATVLGFILLVTGLINRYRKGDRAC